MPSTDPENEPITYTVEVYDADDTLVASVSGVSGTVTSVTTTIEGAGGELVNGQTYEWRARAHDASGGMSDFSERNAFLVDAPIDDPEVVVNGGGCQTGSEGRSGLLMLGLVGLGAAVARRRRRA
jgi:MYXO-CTERM domain-containing protein